MQKSTPFKTSQIKDSKYSISNTNSNKGNKKYGSICILRKDEEYNYDSSENHFLKKTNTGFLIYKPYIYSDNDIEFNIIDDFFFDEKFFEKEEFKTSEDQAQQEEFFDKETSNINSKPNKSKETQSKFNNSTNINKYSNTQMTLKNKCKNIHSNSAIPNEQFFKPLKKRLITKLNNHSKVFHGLDLSKLLYTGYSLGEGYFGKVELVKLKANDKLYALKILRKSKIKEKKNFEHLMNEISILKDTEFPFILKIYSTFQDEQRLYMLMEYVEGGELMKIMSKERIFSEKLIKFVVSQIVLILEYLHSQNIIYRDIKPENILIDMNGYIKLADFGLSKYLGDSSEDNTKTFCGTPEFIPPEILRAEEYGK